MTWFMGSLAYVTYVTLAVCLQFKIPKTLEKLAVCCSDSAGPVSDDFGSSKWVSGKSSVFQISELLRN